MRGAWVRTRRGASCRRARTVEALSARSSATSRLSPSIRSRTSSRSGASSTASSPPCPTSTSTSRVHPREAHRPVTSAMDGSMPRSWRARDVRSRGAIRDVGKALGFHLPSSSGSPDFRTAGTTAGGGGSARLPDGARSSSPAAGARSPGSRARSLVLPRHALAAPGRDDRLHAAVDRARARAARSDGRSQLCQWDKDSCSDAGPQIDLLGLGMLSAVEDCVEQIAGTPARSSTSRASLRRSCNLRRHPACDTVGAFPDREPSADAESFCDEAGVAR